MHYKLYTTSIKAWDAMIKAIEGANKSIYLEMYIFLDDTAESHDFIGKLIAKSKEGIKVIIVTDAYGSKLFKKETVEKLERAGIEILFFSHWLRHIHRKVMIIDEKFAFLGGVNIGKKFSQWKDLQMKISGKIAKRLLKSFAYTYAMAGGKNEKLLKLRKMKFSYKLKFWLIEHWPGRNIFTLREHYTEKIIGAKEKIQIVSPYFTPPKWMLSLLDDAIRRGVAVEIYVPDEVDIPIMNRVNLHYIDKIYSIGAKIFLAQEMNHAKIFIIDGKEGLIGSQNIDLASFRYNSEIGIFFTDKKLLQELSGILEDWTKESDEYRPLRYRMRIIDYIILALSKLLYPIL
jgi:cardiolipin synthase